MFLLCLFYRHCLLQRVPSAPSCINGAPRGAETVSFQLRSALPRTASTTFMTDAVNKGVQVFSNSGAYLRQWGQLSFPIGIAISRTDNVYFADSQGVKIFDLFGVFLGLLGTTGSGAGQFTSPYGISLDSSDNIYITDAAQTTCRVQAFADNGTYIRQWGSLGTGSGQFTNPFGLAMSSKGVHVDDAFLNRTQSFNIDGMFISQAGSQSGAPGQYRSPYDIAADAVGDIYVGDTGNQRVQMFGNDDAYLSQFQLQEPTRTGGGQRRKGVCCCWQLNSSPHLQNSAQPAVHRRGCHCAERACLRFGSNHTVDDFRRQDCI